MTDKQETSRHWILDAIECIKNCEAIVSHCNEIMDSIYDNVSKNDKAYNDYMNLNRMKEIATKVRRKTMRKIFESFDNADHQYWCILKHAVAAKWFMDEVVAADNDDDKPSLRSNEPHDLYELMSLAISSFIWVEPQVCARCMADDLEDDDTIILADNHLDVWFKYRWVLDDKRDLRNQSDVFIWDFFIVKNDWDKEINEEFVWTGEWWFKHPWDITDEMKKEMRLAAKKEQDENARV